MQNVMFKIVYHQYGCDIRKKTRYKNAECSMELLLYNYKKAGVETTMKCKPNVLMWNSTENHQCELF